jgi:hypothetical protein
VGRDTFLELRALRGTVDDRREDRRLKPVPLEPAEHRRLSCRAQERELTRERRRERLTPRLSALAAAHEQRWASALEIEVGPVECDQLGSAEAGLDERAQDEPVALSEAVPTARRVRSGGQ